MIRSIAKIKESKELPSAPAHVPAGILDSDRAELIQKYKSQGISDEVAGKEAEYTISRRRVFGAHSRHSAPRDPAVVKREERHKEELARVVAEAPAGVRDALIRGFEANGLVRDLAEREADHELWLRHIFDNSMNRVLRRERNER